MAEENNSTKQLEALKKSGRAHTKYAQKLIITATLTATPLTVQANAKTFILKHLDWCFFIPFVFIIFLFFVQICSTTGCYQH